MGNVEGGNVGTRLGANEGDVVVGVAVEGCGVGSNEGIAEGI